MPLLFGYLQSSPPWLLPWILPGLCPGPRQGLCPWTPLGAPPPNPWPAFEKAGENQLVNFCGFPAECAGPPLIGSGGLGWFEESRGWKGWWMDRLDGGKSQRSGGGGGVWQAVGPMGPHGLPNKKSRALGLWPPPMLCALCAPPAPPGNAGVRYRRANEAPTSPPPGSPAQLAPPSRYGFHQRQKGNAKARPFI